MSIKKIAIVTPLRNEIENIDKLFDALSKQTITIFSWVILENGSTDGSIEKLKNIKCPNNVEHLEILNLTKNSINYELGSNYARINNFGFNFLKQQDYYQQLDFIGILDSDIFLEETYYEKLLSIFKKDKKLGISSGVIMNLDGTLEKTSNNWVRGGCRLWSADCFNQTGYLVGLSADSLSTAKAICNGWLTYPNISAKAFSRPVGSRVNYRYYGEASYFRGCNPIYILAKYFYQLLKLKLKEAKGLLVGYFSCYFKNKDRVTDKQVRSYYRYYPLSRMYFAFKNK
jgi:glycosyltransferase involved in cell wall biosynthesis